MQHVLNYFQDTSCIQNFEGSIETTLQTEILNGFHSHPNKTVSPEKSSTYPKVQLDVTNESGLDLQNKLTSSIIDFEENLPNEIGDFLQFDTTDNFEKTNYSFLCSTIVSEHNYSRSSLPLTNINQLSLNDNCDTKSDSKDSSPVQFIGPMSNNEEIINAQSNDKVSEEKGKNKRVQKYCDAFPAINTHYDQSGKTMNRRPVIRNATTLLPKVINKKKYVIRNTSAFDVIAEVLIFGYSNVRYCREYCDNIKSKIDKTNIMRAVIQFCSCANFQNFYTSRSTILFKHGSKENDNIFCRDKIGVLVSKMMENIFSFKETLRCDSCGLTRSETETRILVSSNTSSCIIPNLSQDLISYFNSRNLCLMCHKECSVNREFGPFVVIDIENLELSHFLQTIPVEIDITNNKFALIGAIGSELEEATGEMQYIAYCRSFENIWYEHNDIKRYVKRLAKLPKIHMSLFIYILCE